MHINWDEYFMGIALLSSKRSKDPNTQIGACIVNSENKIVGVGYNGAPTGWNDDKFPWTTKGQPIDEKYPYVIHAELNAILNSSMRDLKGSTLYVSFFPCNECAKSIAQTGIKRIVYLSDKYSETDTSRAARRIFDATGVKYELFKPTIDEIILSFDANQYSHNYGKSHVSLK